jgi:hypothetical protein
LRYDVHQAVEKRIFAVVLSAAQDLNHLKKRDAARRSE